jgi:DNA-binding response OmpR family regulator
MWKMSRRTCSDAGHVQAAPHLELVTASDGAQAAQLGVALRPALLLMDLRLPDCWGSDLLASLRSRFRWRQVPAIAVTAESGFDPARNGFIETWQKPLDLRFVLGRLDKVLPDARSAYQRQSAAASGGAELRA